MCPPGFSPIARSKISSRTRGDFLRIAIWLDGLYGGETALRLQERLGIPLFYRSHNIEFLYMRSQARVATSLRDRCAWSVAALHLQAFEHRVRNAATEIFDLSVDDIAYWAGQGAPAGVYAPPLFRSAVIRAPSPEWDVVFLGNFNTPNNLRGLRWFLDEVYPILVAEVPDIDILFAGSSQDENWRTFLARYPRVSLIENPPDSGAILANGRVLINPIFSGSGVNIKAIEMLLCGSPIVTTTVGVRGLPLEFRSAFGVADRPEEFARLILEGRNQSDPAPHRDVEATFGSEGIVPLIEAIRRHLQSAAEGKPVQSV